MSLQSELARSIIASHNLTNKELDSIILIDKDQIFTESTAILHILNKLKGPIKCLIPLWMIPKLIRDKGYRFIAKTVIPGLVKSACMIPTQDIKNRFIE